jgi:hypothetical protein
MRAILIVFIALFFCALFIVFFTVFLQIPLILLGGFLIAVTVLPKRRPRRAGPAPPVMEPEYAEVGVDD